MQCLLSLHRVSRLKLEIPHGYQFFWSDRRDSYLWSKCSFEQWVCSHQSFITIPRTQPKAQRIDWEYPPKPPSRFSGKDFVERPSDWTYFPTKSSSGVGSGEASGEWSHYTLRRFGCARWIPMKLRYGRTHCLWLDFGWRTNSTSSATTRKKS